MVGKVFLYGISFKIVYNQSGLRYDTFLIPFVSQSSGKTINLVKTEMEEHEATLCFHISIK